MCKLKDLERLSIEKCSLLSAIFLVSASNLPHSEIPYFFFLRTFSGFFLPSKGVSLLSLCIFAMNEILRLSSTLRNRPTNEGFGPLLQFTCNQRKS